MSNKRAPVRRDTACLRPTRPDPLDATQRRAAAIENRAAIADHGCDAMIALCPAWTIDTLLTHPRQATQVAQYVLRKMHRPPNDANVHQVLRALLSSRKRGDLKRDRA